MNKNIYNLFRYAAIAGNVAFILWMLMNGIDDGFKATHYQIVSYVGLFLLLALNSFLILKKQ